VRIANAALTTPRCTTQCSTATHSTSATRCLGSTGRLCIVLWSLHTGVAPGTQEWHKRRRRRGEASQVHPGGREHVAALNTHSAPPGSSLLCTWVLSSRYICARAASTLTEMHILDSAAVASAASFDAHVAAPAAAAIGCLAFGECCCLGCCYGSSCCFCNC
jgi:hypothetical protein